MMKPKSCPFCGGAETEVRTESATRYFANRLAAVICRECGATGPIKFDRDAPRAIHAAVAAWNAVHGEDDHRARKTLPPAAPTELDGLQWPSSTGYWCETFRPYEDLKADKRGTLRWPECRENEVP